MNKGVQKGSIEKLTELQKWTASLMLVVPREV